MLDKLVTLIGGGGFLGRYVVQDLLSAGARIRVAERNPGDAFFLKPLGGLGQTQFVAADITKPETLGRALEGADVAINFVGILDGDFRKVHVDGAANAARAARDAGTGDFIQVSAMGAAKNALSRYAQTKALGEEAVREAVPDAIIFRPSVVFGPEDGFINRFAAMARMIPGALPVMRPETKFQPAYVADVAEAIAKAAMAPAPYRAETYELGGPQVLSMMEVNRFVIEAIGKGGKAIVPVPDGVGKAMARLGFLPGAPISWDQWQSLQSDNVMSEGAKGFEAFAIEPRPLAAVADQWLVQYRDHGRFAGKASQAA